MSDEAKSDNGEWTMPDPVFRSSEGRTPKSAKNYVDPDDIDTAAPEFSEADTDEFDTEPADQDEIDTETPETGAEDDTKEYPAVTAADVTEEPSEPVVRTSEKPAKSAGGCAKNVLMMFGLTTFVVVAIVAVVIYFLFFYTPANTTF
ncbi:MAG: hypothetical protein ABL999_01365 [Pyrinomonadaceae bacterium]